LADLETEFAGIRFPNPLIVASGPLGTSGETLKRCARAGAGGLITKTIAIQRRIETELKPRYARIGDKRCFIGMQNIGGSSHFKPEIWAQKEIKIAKECQVPVIANIAAGGDINNWAILATMMENAGADMLELNLSCPHQPPKSSFAVPIGQNPMLTSQVTKIVKENVSIPIMVKLTPTVNNIRDIAKAAAGAGADAISAINTISCLAGIDIATEKPLIPAFGGYSGPAIKPIALRCIAEIAQSVQVPISGIGGITTWQDVIEMMMVGATTVQICTAAMWKGVGIFKNLLTEIGVFLDKKGYKRPVNVVGKSLKHIFPFEKYSPQYRVAKVTSSCTNCGICVETCFYDAIQRNKETIDIISERCFGCGLCAQRCPMHAIELEGM
jgi:dihydropyrimidine dehydrogenase (NAD+) subunit PreA